MSAHGSRRMGVMLPAYRRPGLVADFLDHWRSVGAGYDLVVVVDGPASDATGEDLERRAGVIRIAERYAAQIAGVDLVVRSRNTFGRAMVAAYREFGQRFEALAVLEEDNRITAEGLAFLERAVTGDDRPRHAAAFTATSHLGIEPREARVSLFPEQWGVAMNAAFVERLDAIVRVGRFDRRVVTSTFRPVLGDHARFDLLVDRWLRRVRRGYLSRHEDAMFQYTAWACGSLTAVPWGTFVEDVGHLEAGGYSARPGGGVPAAPAHAPVLRRTRVGLLCATCERRGAGEPRERASGIHLRLDRAAAEREWRRRRRQERRRRIAEHDDGARAALP